MSPGKPRVLVWDLPTRLFHWLLALSFIGAYATADGERWRDVHVILGYTAGVLVLFRLAWGVVGTRYARFAEWKASPRRALGYLRSLVSGRPEQHVGHNPAGSLAILGLIALTLATVATGLANYNEVGGGLLEEAHELLANTMLALVVVHIAGVVVGSIVHRENLPGAMLTGRKRAAPEAAIKGTRPVAAALLLALVLGLWAGVVPAPGLSAPAELTSISAGPGANRYARAVRDDD